MASYVYKRFTPQDYRVTPFNAHKQYDFNSSSAASNSVKIFSSRYTSESVSVYSSASSNSLGIFDSINNIKYNQLDYLFYRDYLSNIGNIKDFIDHKKQIRNLYEKANIISIPAGLYGQEIRKNSFYLSSSQYEVVDDSKGNLIISGTNLNDYPSDVDRNVFRLDPIKGFKKHDLTIYDGYAVTNKYYPPWASSPQEADTMVYNQYYRQGQINPNASASYTSPFENRNVPVTNVGTSIDRDDSYFSNILKYNKVNFQTSSLGSNSHKFSSIRFHSISQSNIEIPHNSRFNFNRDDDFAVSFWITPKATGSQNNMSNLEKRYIIAKSGTQTIVNKPPSGVGALPGSASIEEAGPQYPFEIFMVSQSLYFVRSDGSDIVSIDAELTSSDSVQKASHVLCQNSSSVLQLYIDGIQKVSMAYTLSGSTKNKANLYIGSRGPLDTKVDSGSKNVSVGTAYVGSDFVVDNFHISQDEYNYRTKHFNGELGNINIWNRAYNSTQIENISESINASPYIGNLFYRTGFATITHPNYYSIA